MKQKLKKTACIFLWLMIAVVLIISCYQIYTHYSEEKTQTQEFDELVSLIETTAPAASNSPFDEMPAEASAEQTAYEKYAALFEQNRDMVGWIQIEGTIVNYPVMQTPDCPNYYLKHNFDKKYSDLGVPFVSEICDLLHSDNIVIYGHHIKGKKMFGALDNYKSKDFFLEHPIIKFDTRTDFGEYEIIAVFRTTPERFNYYEFINAADQTAYDEFVSRCKALSFYETGKTAMFGDKLLTLSTCEYSEKNSRLVVVAKKLP